MLCCGTNKPSDFEKIFCQQLIQKHIDKNIDVVRSNVFHMLKLKNKSEIKNMINNIKKVIKMPLEAENKFYALLLLNDIMNARLPFVVKHFLKKIKNRLFIMANFVKNPKEMHLKSKECLDE